MRTLRGISEAAHAADLTAPLPERELEVLWLVATDISNRSTVSLLYSKQQREKS